MAKCDFCGKDVAFGIRVSHSHRRTNRTWKPNVMKVKAIVNASPAVFTPAPAACVPARLPERNGKIGLKAEASPSAFCLSVQKGRLDSVQFADGTQAAFFV